MGQTLDCFCKGIGFTQSHRPEEAIPILTTNVNQAQEAALQRQITSHDETLDWSVQTLGREGNSIGLCIHLNITRVASTT